VSAPGRCEVRAPQAQGAQGRRLGDSPDAWALDHLVLAARSLEDGARWCVATLGLVPGPGGRHASMGTHNRLFSIAGPACPGAYFEIIAIDPQAPPPGRARWFGLDGLDLAGGPRLIHWVARTTALDAGLAALRVAGIDAGEAIAAARDTPAGRLQWRIAVRGDGALLYGGALPTLIEWGDRHPAATMPPSGVQLCSLTLRGLPAAIAARVESGAVGAAHDAGASLTAVLNTARGVVTLASH
jgi:hypothetical protein